MDKSELMAMTRPTILVLPFEERGPIPNNPRFPALVYRKALSPDLADPASVREGRFEENGWPPAWRNGIYDFHHYHRKGDEVGGIVSSRLAVDWLAEDAGLVSMPKAYALQLRSEKDVRFLATAECQLLAQTRLCP